jgi:cephalosporin-C deacetylase-like acetyl esterase
MPAGPHFEIGSSQETKVASWSMAQGGAIHATDTAPAPDASKVALVMPFAGRAATASPAPV